MYDLELNFKIYFYIFKRIFFDFTDIKVRLIKLNFEILKIA